MTATRTSRRILRLLGAAAISLQVFVLAGVPASATTMKLPAPENLEAGGISPAQRIGRLAVEDQDGPTGQPRGMEGFISIDV